MKKLMAIALAATLAVSMTACGNNGTTSPVQDDTQGKTALDILTDVWAAYSEDEKFAVAGGDYENMVSDAPGTVNVTDGETLNTLFGFPADSTALIDDGASLMHMMNQNNFTAAVYHVTDAKEVSGIAAALKDSIMSKQWICGFPEEMQIFSVGEQYVVTVFGTADALDSFEEHLETVYKSTQDLYDEDIR
jgi:hypothetical protein